MSATRPRACWTPPPSLRWRGGPGTALRGIVAEGGGGTAGRDARPSCHRAPSGRCGGSGVRTWRPASPPVTASCSPTCSPRRAKRVRVVGAAAARPAGRGGPGDRAPARGVRCARGPGPLARRAPDRLAADHRLRCRRGRCRRGRCGGRRCRDTSGDQEVWRTGSRGERQAYLAAQRRRDPTAGRELLTADWARQTGDERAALLAVLVRGLSADDEEFLDAALDDRAAAVRGVARRLLTLLPGSRFGRRATERAAAVLRLERRGLRERWWQACPAIPTPPRSGTG